MSNDLVPQGRNWLDELNLPKLVAGPAGQAISRLISGVVDIPFAGLERVSQGIRDKTEAKSLVSKALAEAVAASVKEDPALIERASHSFLARGLRRQVTREAIARKTLVILQEDEPPPGSTAEPEHHKVDEDWLNTFERYAEDASSDRLQDLWASVLAGELRKPKAFSLQTLRFVAELDQEIATTFERWASAVLFGEFIPRPPEVDPHISEIVTLEESGLFSSPLSNLAKFFNFEPGLRSFPYKTHSMFIQFEAAQTISFPIVALTRVGREIYSIIHPPDDIEHAKRFAMSLPKNNILHIFYAPTTAMRDGSVSFSNPSVNSLWHKPASTSS